jgi:DNA-binding transcriptional regulator YdaS (Cro superfamily)
MIESYVEKFPSKTAFCRAVGICPQYLTQIEKNERPIPPKVCNALERLFGADKKVLRPDIFGDPPTRQDAPT